MRKMALRLGFLKVIYSGWVSMTPPNLHVGRKTIQFLSNLSKIILSQKTADIIL